MPGRHHSPQTSGKAFVRHQGKITHWKDAQGFGFITPNTGAGLKGSASIFCC
jgi:hypothetical protein